MSKQPNFSVADAIDSWFTKQGWQIFPFQRQAWQAYQEGQSGLIHSPTGTGKSYAAWLAPVLAHTPKQVIAEVTAESNVKSKPKLLPITVLWITPLRALAVDTTANLRAPIEALQLPWTVQSRTGDTSSSQKTKQRKRLPSALVTTPESLSLLLSYADTQKQLRTVQCVVVDEWHELLGSKRGVQLELCLARLRAINPALRTWGLSATIGNVPQAAEVLLGSGVPANNDRSTPVIINGSLPKTTKIRSIIPASATRFPWAGHMGLNLLPEVINTIEQASTTLLFANTRSQAERWYEAILAERIDWIDQLALHHGSIDRGLRTKAEAMLREGALKCVVATSSLDLGVDFSPVEQVIQVGSAKGVARLLQRAGRSGHQPGKVSSVICVPAHALELIEIAAARQAASNGEIEAREPLTRSLDVLAQHVVTLALAGGITPEQAAIEARSTYAFAELTDDEWQWVLDFITRGGPALHAYPQFNRVQLEQGQLKVSDRRIALQHRMSIGTITSDSAIKVQFQKGGYLGMVEESFISRLEPGEAFLFAGRKLELTRVRDMTAYVKNASAKKAAVPRWAGGRLPLSNQLAASMLREIEKFSQNQLDSEELQAAAPLLALQQRESALPQPGRLVIERTESREGYSLFFYPFAGRLVHEGLAALLAYRISQQQKISFTFSMNDYGFELLSPDQTEFTEAYFRQLFSAEHLLADIMASINASEMAKRQFRDIARVAGLIFQGYPGSSKTVRQIQASSGLIYDVLVKYDPDNALPEQAKREVLAAQFEIKRLRQCLDNIANSKIVLTRPERLTPMAFPLWAELLGSRVSSETWRERVAKMTERLEKAANKKAAHQSLKSKG